MYDKKRTIPVTGTRFLNLNFFNYCTVLSNNKAYSGTKNLFDDSSIRTVAYIIFFNYKFHNNREKIFFLEFYT